MNKLQIDLGEIVVTPAARNTLDQQGIRTSTLLRQHINEEWEHIFNSEGDKDGFQVSRMMSSQKVPHGELWIVTEFDREVTIIATPDEY